MSDPRTEKGQQQWQDMVAESRERQDPLVRRSEASAIATEIVRRFGEAMRPWRNTDPSRPLGLDEYSDAVCHALATLTPTQAAEPAASEPVMLWRAWNSDGMCFESVDMPWINDAGYLRWPGGGALLGKGTVRTIAARDQHYRSRIEWIGPSPDPRLPSERQAAAVARPEVVAWRYNNRGGLQHFSPSRPSGWPVTEALVLASASTAAIEAAEREAHEAKMECSKQRALANHSAHEAENARGNALAEVHAKLAKMLKNYEHEVERWENPHRRRAEAGTIAILKDEVLPAVEAMRGRKGQ